MVKRYLSTAYIMDYDGNTMVRIVTESDGVKLAVASDLIKALGYNSPSACSRILGSCGIESCNRSILVKEGKGGVTQVKCIDYNGVALLLDKKSMDPAFSRWMLGIMKSDDNYFEDDEEYSDKDKHTAEIEVRTDRNPKTLRDKEDTSNNGRRQEDYRLKQVVDMIDSFIDALQKLRNLCS